MQERIQKIISKLGITSRRKSEELILEGAVTINGKTVTELGTKADVTQDHIKVHGKLINGANKQYKKVYLLLNKPKGYLSSLSDPDGRPLVTTFLPVGTPRVYPVGRLDFKTEGLLILTNDGDLANLVASAGEHCPKIYHVKVKGIPRKPQIELLRKGMTIEGEYYKIANLEELRSDSDENAWYQVTLYEGRNNQIRKMFEKIGHSVVKLRRVAIGPITDKRLRPGEVRELTQQEIKRLFNLAKKR